MKSSSTKSVQPVIWIKTPKCAGTSFQGLLRKHDMLFLIEDAKTVSLEELRQNGNRVCQVRHGHLYILEERFPEWVNTAWIFSIVRNPWDRFVSGWRYCESTRWRFFSDVVNNPPTKEEHLQDWHHMTLPLSGAMKAADGRILCNNYIRFEELPGSLNPVLRRIGLPESNLPYKNRGRHKDFRLYYTGKTWSLVEKRFQEDIDLFGYEHSAAPRSTIAGLLEQQRTNAIILWNRLLRTIFRQHENDQNIVDKIIQVFR